MKLCFVDESWEDYLYWQKTLNKINKLIKDISSPPTMELENLKLLSLNTAGFGLEELTGNID